MAQRYTSGFVSPADQLYAAVLSSTRAVILHMKRLRCPAFDSGFPSLAWWREYVSSQANLMMFENVEELPNDVLGVVLKKLHRFDQGSRCLYMIITGPVTSDVLARLVIAHEVGHILLHGRILPVHAQLVDRPRQPLGGRERSNKMEIEANIYSLMCLIPTGLISAIEEASWGSEPEAESLQLSLMESYGSYVDPKLASERLLLHRIAIRDPASDNTELRREFDQLIASTPSWIVDGPAAMRGRIEHQDDWTSGMLAAGSQGRYGCELGKVQEILRRDGILEKPKLKSKKVSRGLPVVLAVDCTQTDSGVRS